MLVSARPTPSIRTSFCQVMGPGGASDEEDSRERTETTSKDVVTSDSEATVETQRGKKQNRFW